MPKRKNGEKMIVRKKSRPPTDIDSNIEICAWILGEQIKKIRHKAITQGANDLTSEELDNLIKVYKALIFGYGQTKASMSQIIGLKTADTSNEDLDNLIRKELENLKQSKQSTDIAMQEQERLIKDINLAKEDFEI